MRLDCQEIGLNGLPRRIGLLEFEPLPSLESGGSVCGWGSEVAHAESSSAASKGINRIRFYLSVKIFNGVDEVSDGLFCFQSRLSERHSSLFYLQIAH